MTNETEEQRKVRLGLHLLQVLAEEGLQLVKHGGWGYLSVDDSGRPYAVLLFNDYDRPLAEQAYTSIPWHKVVKIIDQGPRRLP